VRSWLCVLNFVYNHLESTLKDKVNTNKKQSQEKNEKDLGEEFTQ
jgi:pullulanase/glycogen debranching enzyme